VGGEAQNIRSEVVNARDEKGRSSKGGGKKDPQWARRN